MKLKNIVIDYIYKGFPFKPESGCYGVASVFLIKIDNNGILFDTGGYGARSLIKKRIDNNEIDMVVISHLHFDHCTNLDLFIDTGIPIYISDIEIKEYFKNKSSDLDLYSNFEFILDSLNIIRVYEEIKIYDNIKIIFTPGHTLGHMSLAISECLLAGDAIKTINDYKNINLFGNAVNPSMYISTKKKLVLNYKHIFLGHDGEVLEGQLINRGEIYEF